jgi:hypothetical protein
MEQLGPSGPLNTAREISRSSGTQTAALAFGGILTTAIQSNRRI